MKAKFTLLQKIFITLFIGLILGCIGGDIYALSFKDSDSSKYTFGVNIGLCVLVLTVFLLLIRNPAIIISDHSASDNESDVRPIISASRTFLCLIAFDVAAVMAFVLYGSEFIKYPKLVVIAFAVTVFVVASIKYIVDSRKIGIADSDGTDDTDEPKDKKDSAIEKAEDKASEEDKSDEVKAVETTDNNDDVKEDTESSTKSPKKVVSQNKNYPAKKQGAGSKKNHKKKH